MSDEAIDPRWSRLLSLAVHEFRTPITVSSGYLRMVLRDKAGPITDQQRKLLEEAEKACGRLSALVSGMSDLSSLEEGKIQFNQTSVDLATLLDDEIAALPESPDPSIRIELEAGERPVEIAGDASRLRIALRALLVALRREVVHSDRLIVRLHTRGREVRITVGEPARIDAIDAAIPSSLERFDEWRGGTGLSLAIARRILGRHGGSLYAAPGADAQERKGGAVVVLARK